MKSVKEGGGGIRLLRSSLKALVFAATVLSMSMAGSASAGTAQVTWTLQEDFENNQSTTHEPTTRDEMDTSSIPGSVLVGPKSLRSNGAFFRKNEHQFPLGMTADAKTNRIYVPGVQTVTVLDASTGETIGFIPMAKTPRTLLVSTGMNKLYATNSGENSISVYDLNTNELLKTITLATGPVGLVYNPATEKVYAAHADNTVSVIYGNSDEVVRTVAVGTSPAGGVYNPADKNVYVLNDHDVSIIDGVTDQVVGTIAVYDAASTNYLRTAVVNTSGSKLYVTAGYDVVVIGIPDRKVIKAITVGGWMTSPTNLVYDNQHDKVYAFLLYGQAISVINAVTDTFVKRIPLDNQYIDASLACSPASGKLFAGENIIDTATDTIITKLKNFAAKNAMHDPVLNKLYVMSDNLVIIDTMTSKVAKVVKINNPYFAVSNPNNKKLFVLEENRTNVSIVDMNSYETIGRVALPYSCSDAVYNSVNNRVYVIKEWDHSITVLDGDTGAIVKQLSFPGTPNGKAVYQPATNKIYSNGKIIDCATDTVIGTIAVTGHGTADPNSSKIYFAYNGITTVDSATDQVLGTVGGSLPGKENFNRIAFDPVGNRFIAANATTVFVLDAASGETVETLTLPVGGVSKAFFNHDNRKTFIMRMFQDWSTFGNVYAISDFAGRGLIGGDAARVALRSDTNNVAGGATLFDAYSVRYSYLPLEPGQNIRFRVRSANDTTSLSAASYFGPDGTAATWYDATTPGAVTNAEGTETVIQLVNPGAAVPPVFQRYVEIEFALTANGVSPRLDEVKLELDAIDSPLPTSLAQLHEDGSAIVKPTQNGTVLLQVSGLPTGLFAQFEMSPVGSPFSGNVTAAGANADAAGKSTVVLTLNEGLYHWRARIALNAGSATAWTEFPGTLNVDKTPPALAITVNTVTGTMEAGATVAVMSGAPVVVQPVQYPTSTTWSCTLSNLAPGPNPVAVTVSDEAGNLTYTTFDLHGF